MNDKVERMRELTESIKKRNARIHTPYRHEETCGTTGEPCGDHRPGASVYCASPAAIGAAALAYPGNDAKKLSAALLACHDPALGVDRSVCLRDVMAVLWGMGPIGAEFAGRLQRDFDRSAPDASLPT